MACQTDESVERQVVDMDTDDDESEIDNGEEEERMQRLRCQHYRRRQRLHLSQSTGREIIPTLEIDMSIDRDMKRKPIIELRLPQVLDSLNVCIVPIRCS
jgi:hypothetical protein